MTVEYPIGLLCPTLRLTPWYDRTAQFRATHQPFQTGTTRTRKRERQYEFVCQCGTAGWSTNPAVLLLPKRARTA